MNKSGRPAVLRQLKFHREGYCLPVCGDEFILILPDATLEVTRERAELICKLARQFQLHFEGQRLAAVTLSLGVAVFPAHGATSTGILRAVNAALYRDKYEGRSRVVVAE